MNILFDGVFNAEPKSGVHKYFYNLIKYLPHEYKKFSSTSVSQPGLPNHFIPFLKHFRPHRLSCLLEYLWFTNKCQSTQFNLVHSAFYNLSKSCEILISNGIPHIITVHDLIHELFEEQKNEIVVRRTNILQNAKAIIAVSNNTKNDLIKAYPSIDENKIFVIHHGINSNNSYSNSEITKEFSKPFLLQVGHREDYKNFDILLPTLKRLQLKHDLDLVAVGPPKTSQEEIKITELGLTQSVKVLTNISNKELEKLYRKCTALVYPSKYEGFGYPLIESMANGAIPVAFKTSCIPEILGDAGLKIDSIDSHALAAGIAKLIENEEFKQSLKVKSINRIKYFPIVKMARMHIKLYNKVIKQKNLN